MHSPQEMVCLPVAPLSDPEGQPGLRMLIESYTSRMETTISSWYKNILEVDMNGAPQQMSDGTLRTPGAVDFFRILNEQVGVSAMVSMCMLQQQAVLDSGSCKGKNCRHTVALSGTATEAMVHHALHQFSYQDISCFLQLTLVCVGTVYAGLCSLCCLSYDLFGSNS